MAVHESGHSVVAAALGLEVTSAGITRATTPGALGGCTRWAHGPLDFGALDVTVPWVLWPASLRQRVERDVLVLMAGETAVAVLRPRFGRVGDPVGVRALGLVTGEQAAALQDLPDTDAVQVARAVRFAFGSEHQDEAAAWLCWAAASTKALVIEHQAAIGRVAGALLTFGVLDNKGVAAAIEQP